MKEQYLSKTPFLTFVHVSKCYINLPCYFGNSKKKGFVNRSNTQSSPSMPPWPSSPPRCIKIAILIAIIEIIMIIVIIEMIVNHLYLQVQAANTGPAKYKGLTDVVFSLYRFAPFKFLIHLILCIIVVRIMTTTNVSSRCHHHHHHFLFFLMAPTLPTRNKKFKR